MSARRSAARALAALALSIVALAASSARAEEAGPVAAASGIALDTSLVLGRGIAAGDGWFSVLVRVHNTTEQEIAGTLVVDARGPGASSLQAVTRAPFAVAGRSTVVVQLPTHGFSRSSLELGVRALDPSGSPLPGTALSLPDPGALEPLVVDLGVPSRIAAGIRGRAVAGARIGSSRGYGVLQIQVGSPTVVPATGDLALPEVAAGWASATVVLSDVSRLASLRGEQLEALVSWVLAGGALAVYPKIPEDLRDPTLVSLVGGEVTRAPPAAALSDTRSFVVADESSWNTGRTLRETAAPVAAVARALTGWSGGNLRPTPFGAAASYGLGEVHVLAFDPWDTTHVTDRWVVLSVADLVRHAWERRTTVAFPHAAAALDVSGVDDVRRQLDPNEGARWSIAVAAALLLLYSVLAGPISFWLAARRGRPLRALVWLPIASAIAFFSIVALGIVARGVSGRARRLTLVESGAGIGRAAATRFRGFFASSSERLTVRASDRGHVLDVAGAEPPARTLVLDRDGARLEALRARPWETVVVREDGFLGLGGGVSVVPAGASAVVKNRTARDLVAVVVKLPGEPAVFFARVRDGESVDVATGSPLDPRIGRSGGSAGALRADLFTASVDSAAIGAGAAWGALEQAAPGTEWWPRDVPVVLAQLDGGEGKTSDSGLSVDVDRALVRVVGWGGVP
ncbi:MAG: hypothetical protein IT376_05805 [Polyangiaceae bacterium]|nr:hypothetical protein [Polyangiaceae bacterium]